MRELGKAFVQFFVSLKLTVVLLGLSAVLVFFATLDQTELGVWGIQQKWFQSFIVIHTFKAIGIPLPVLPGGYFIGGLLFFNLVAAHIYRFKLSWKKSGLLLTHLGLLVLLLGQLFTGLLQEEYQLRVSEGETKSYSESPQFNELAIIDATDAEMDDVVAIPEKLLNGHAALQHPKLPFRVVVKDYFPNAVVQMRNQVPNAPPSPATTGMGPQLVATPLPLTYKTNERNMPTAYVELVGPGGSLGTWLLSTQLGEPQTFDFEGKSWRLIFRPQRNYTDYALTLIKFSHDVYPGTDIPKNFSSQVHLKSNDGKTDREVLIYMNNPLRFEGLTFYQAGYDGEHATVLQVVKNPSWLLPYVACGMLFLGLVIHFGISLVSFASKRSRKTKPAITAA